MHTDKSKQGEKNRVVHGTASAILDFFRTIPMLERDKKQ